MMVVLCEDASFCVLHAGQNIQLYPGDELSWSCTYNTSGLNRTVYGGYAGYSEEM
jgi:hypothetical protein